jgi:hypothetical protein
MEFAEFDSSKETIAPIWISRIWERFKLPKSLLFLPVPFKAIQAIYLLTINYYQLQVFLAWIRPD